MESVRLTPDITSTRIGLGCGGLMREPANRKRQRLLDEAFDQGIRHFDVARMYGLGAAEGELGRFARGRRDQVVIATKFGIEPPPTSGRLARLQGPARWLLARYPALRSYVKKRADASHEPRNYDAATARTSLQTSLRELQTDYVDLLLVHDPAPTDRVDLPSICAYLEEAREAGHLRAWGVAGEQEPCIHIKQSLPATAILQTREDILSRISHAPNDLEPLITFGVLSNALRQITDHLKESARRRSQWSKALGIDCSPQTVASLLLRDALDSNPRGVVLYSTIRPDRLSEVKSIASGTHNHDDPQLAEFRRMVKHEILSPSELNGNIGR
ncbi:MAG: aldo/keto reductase [Solirubrobacteraceae bacterium]